MNHVRLIHWNAAEAQERALRLQACGYEVDFTPLDGPAAVRRLRDDPPAAVVIDLSRLPSHGRDVGLALRKSKLTRHLPLVFVEGNAERTARVRQLLPDAVYATWERIAGWLQKAISHPPADPVIPSSVMAGYSDTPLPKKLGIREDSVVVLVGAPQGFEQTLGKLPAGASLRKQARGTCDLVIWFTNSSEKLQQRIGRMAAMAGKDGLWIVWPKKSSGVDSDLSQPVVRKVGLASGLVDYKVCAIDQVWTGLRFARRKKK